MNVAETIKAARRVSTPLIAVATPDQAATVDAVVAAFSVNGARTVPLVRWDCVKGLAPLNDAGAYALGPLLGESMPGLPPAGVNIVEALSLARDLPEKSILFLMNAHRFYADEASPAANAAVIQAASNLRDLFKANFRTLVMLCTSSSLPAELAQDVMTVDEPFPTVEELRAIVTRELEAAREAKPGLAMPGAADLDRAAEALCGLAAFPAEQATALTIRASNGAGLEIEPLWTRKIAYIEQTRGLSYDRSKETFEDIGGLEVAKRFGRLLFEGRSAPRAVLRVEEIEKALAGAAGPSGDGGVSKDAHSVLLTAMEDNGWSGMIAAGPPGAAKSLFSKALGRTYGVPTFSLDLGAAKGSYVGQSESYVRQLVKVIKAVAGSGAFFVATCNGVDSLRPELLRRFRAGLWYFDLPTAEERESIWRVQLRAFFGPAPDGTPADSPAPSRAGVDDTNWTGAEIRNVCELAWRLRVSLAEAARYIVPVAVADPASVERIRRMASGRFLSASSDGTYQYRKIQAPTSVAGRKYDAGDANSN